MLILKSQRHKARDQRQDINVSGEFALLSRERRARLAEELIGTPNRLVQPRAIEHQPIDRWKEDEETRGGRSPRRTGLGSSSDC